VIPNETRRLLESAGYAWDQVRGDWAHPRTARVLNGDVAAGMTPEQVSEWIAAGEKERPPK
jgi:hypothetical protein